MPTTTVNISVDIPKSYNVDALQKKLTAYALHLIRMDKSYKKKEKHFMHEALRGVIPQESVEGEYLNNYLDNGYTKNT